MTSRGKKGVSRAPGKERRFYVPPAFEPTMEKLEKILNREGSNLSKWIREQAQRHVDIHWPGQPQPPLESFIDGKPVLPVCPEGERGWCPRAPKLCIHRSKYRCKYG